MRGVIGAGLLILGLAGGYLILTGKFPASTPATAAPAASITASTGAPSSNAVSVSGTGSGPTGLPTMTNLRDMAASSGGMQ